MAIIVQRSAKSAPRTKKVWFDGTNGPVPVGGCVCYDPSADITPDVSTQGVFANEALGAKVIRPTTATAALFAGVVQEPPTAQGIDYDDNAGFVDVYVPGSREIVPMRGAAATYTAGEYVTVTNNSYLITAGGTAPASADGTLIGVVAKTETLAAEGLVQVMMV